MTGLSQMIVYTVSLSEASCTDEVVHWRESDAGKMMDCSGRLNQFVPTPKKDYLPLTHDNW